MSKAGEVWPQLFCHWVPRLVPAVLAVAAMGKVLDWHSFRSSAATFRLLPDVLRSDAALVAVILAECLPLVLVTACLPRLANVTALVIVSGFTMLIIWHRAFQIEPTCSCFGLWQQYLADRSTQREQLVRNGVLVAAAGWSAWATFRRPSTRIKVPVPSPRELRSGFTIAEMLVVISVIGLVVALALPTLAGVRVRGREAKNLANLKSHAAAISSYAVGSGEVLPWLTRPGQTNVLRGGGVSTGYVSYFDMAHVWHVGLSEALYGVSADSDMFWSPRYARTANPDRPRRTDYLFPCAFIAAPEYWSALTRSGASQYRAIFVHEVIFPSQKAMVVESSIRGEEFVSASAAQLLSLFAAGVDGAASARKWSSCKPGYANGDGAQFIADGAVHFADAPAMLHTESGVRGRDW